MKKLLGAIAVLVALSPVSAFAAQTDAQIRASVITQLLSVFVVQTNAIDKVNSLIATAQDQFQFADFKALLKQQSNETVGELATLLNPSGVPVTLATGGSGDSSYIPVQAGGIVPVMPQDQSAVIVKGADAGPDYIPGAYGYIHRNIDPQNGHPFGDYGWTVWVKDSSGNFVKGASVVMSIGPVDDSPTDFKADPNYYTKVTRDTSGCVMADGTCIKNDWNRGFQYVPTTPGVKTLTFTSGNVSQAVSIEVK